MKRFNVLKNYESEASPVKIVNDKTFENIINSDFTTNLKHWSDSDKSNLESTRINSEKFQKLDPYKDKNKKGN